MRKRTTVLEAIRTKKVFKILAVYLSLNLMVDLFSPLTSLALTSGPAQEEFASFEPVGTSDMVNLYSGDFTYNIPLMSVPGPNGGYPLNMAYHSGIGMDQEASWVGLGWNLNVGAINRQLRGLPDDFNGATIQQEMNMKASSTVMLNIPEFSQAPPNKYKEVFGLPSATNSGSPYTWQLYYNNYKGLGYRVMTSLIRANQESVVSGNVGLSFDSQNGIGIEPKLSANGIFASSSFTTGITASAPINTRTGSQGLAFAGDIGAIGKVDQRGNIKGGSLSSNLSFAQNQTVPTVSMPMKTTTYPYTLRIGSANGFGNFASNFPLNWLGSVTTSKVIDGGVVNSAGYGYLHTDNATTTSGDMVDFNREPLEYSKKVPNLAPSSFTYDIFSHSGQGTGGMFRPNRTGVNALSTPTREDLTKSQRFNLEFGNTGNNFHVGVGFTQTSGSTQSGDWESGSDDIDTWLASAGTSDPDFEPNYFKAYGEQTGELLNDEFLDDWKGDRALRVKLEKENGWLNRAFTDSDDFVRSESSPVSATGNAAMHLKKTRQKRGQVIEVLTDDEAALYGVSRNVTYLNSSDVSTAKSFTAHGGNDISEVSILQQDGMRYTYGLPAYNNNRVETNMSVDEATADHNTVTVDVAANTYDGTYKEFLSKTTTPEYVHSWLLTSVVSPDYIDLTDDGPTDDDYGYWTKFNYKQFETAYKWRVPYQEANFVEGNISDDKDNSAYYSYGDKELYYINSVETKTHIAVFYTSDREDALGAYGEYADIGQKDANDRMQKLDSIALFTKNAYYDNQGDPDPNAVPIQTTHFRYTYDLCPNVPNNSGATIDENGYLSTDPEYNGTDVNGKEGKLTLTKLYFTYQWSGRGALSPYEFGYGNINSADDNPDYNIRNVDRWGYFKENVNNDGTVIDNGMYPYLHFPYVNQHDNLDNDTPPNDNAPKVAHWHMKSIELPTGGIMNIEYEADDYGYVEDQHAMHMFDIRRVGGASHSTTSHRGSVNIEEGNLKSHHSNDHNHFRVYFDLDEAVPDALDGTAESRAQYVLDNYVRNMSDVWFKVSVDLKNSGWDHEYITGYADIIYYTTNLEDYMGVEDDDTDGDFDRGYITLKGVSMNKSGIGPKIHPFQKAALEHLKVQRPDIAYGITEPTGSVASQVLSIAGSFFTALDDVVAGMVGFNAWAYAKGWCQDIELNGRSVIRLFDHDSKKYGGGARVSQLSLNDNWENSASTDNALYGQAYDYTIEENGSTVSSGVAYEPAIGGGESPLTQPVKYTHSTFLGSTRNLFVEKPILKSYYPGASVGYRKVTVRSIAPDEADDDSKAIENSVAPVAVHEFYTAKDFPIIFDQTDMNADPAITRPIMIPGVYSSFKKRMARSQGYSIVMNDMPGKLKSVAQYTRRLDGTAGTDELGSLLSKQEYIYQTKDPYNNDKRNQLDNHVQVLNDAGNYQTAVLGQTVDVFLDRHENFQSSKSRGLDLNLELTISIPPLIWIMPLPYLEDNETSVKTLVTTKVIHRSGVLQETIVTTDQSQIKTENLAYDIETGTPLLTKVTNEFRNPVYSYNYPAHWYYDNTGTAYQNIGIEFNDVDVTGSMGVMENFTLPAGKDVSDYFIEGDFVYIDYDTETDVRATVVEVDAVNNEITCIEADGEYVVADAVNQVTIIRSGRKNLLTTNVGNLVARELTGFNRNQHTSAQTYALDQIVDASAIELADEWQVFCDTYDSHYECGDDPGDVVNPYVAGIKGLWRPEHSYVFNTNREYHNNIQFDEVYDEFVAFPWSNPGSKDAKWLATNTITKHSPHGYELENKDALHRYSAALYGYENTLATAVGANTTYNEMAFDGYEDYTDECTDQHFKFNGYSSYISTDEAHTGTRSFKINSGATKSLTRRLAAKDCSTYQYTPDHSTDYYQVDSCDCLGFFRPEAGERYVLSAWIKEVHSTPQAVESYDDAKIKVTFNGGGTSTITLSPTGKIVEGWQRVFVNFIIPSGTTEIIVNFDNTAAATAPAYYDDIRLHPFDGNMVSYVYDPVTLKLVAELDANNYATFYIYDEEGKLVKVKKETVEGIKTIQEGRNSSAIAP